jgi:hypothetical protein
MTQIGTAEAERIYALAAERGLDRDQVNQLAYTKRLTMDAFTIERLSGARSRQLIDMLPAGPTAATPAAATTAEPAHSHCSARQADYIADLLAERARSGEGGGFASVERLYTQDGKLDLAAIANLSPDSASMIIRSLTGDY